MRFKPTCRLGTCVKRVRAGFTLAEVLAALTFMAIVIPVAVEGIRIASRAGALAERKTEAVRVAERLLGEAMVTATTVPAAQGGVVEENGREYRWQVRSQLWEKDSLRLVTVQVTFGVQGRDHEVRLSTLVDGSSL